MEFKIVCGSPGAGKNYLVSKNFKDGDIIIDFDRLYDAITCQGVHSERNHLLIGVIMTIRNALINELMRLKAPVNVWVIACKPEGRRREFMARRLRNAQVYLIMPGLERCLEHINADSLTEGEQEYRKKAAEQWHKSYTPSGKDIIIKD